MKILEDHGWVIPVDGGMELDGAPRKHAWRVQSETEPLGNQKIDFEKCACDSCDSCDSEYEFFDGGDSIPKWTRGY
jgi:hypothetical protein